MSARDDYPMATHEWSVDVINRALDEIDRLRAHVEGLKEQWTAAEQEIDRLWAEVRAVGNPGE